MGEDGILKCRRTRDSADRARKSAGGTGLRPLACRRTQKPHSTTKCQLRSSDRSRAGSRRTRSWKWTPTPNLASPPFLRVLCALPGGGPICFPCSPFVGFAYLVVQL